MDTNLEQINQLLDGELDSMHEPSLYGKLAMDADLRSEMREQLAMRMAVQEDRAMLVPPAVLTNRVFSGLGFTAPLAGAATGAAGGSLLLQWLTRLGVPIASAFAAAGLTVGVMNSVPAETNSQSAAINQQPLQITIAGETLQTPPSSVPAVRTVYVTDPAIRERLAILEAENARLRARLAQAELPSTQQVPVVESRNGLEPHNATVALTQSYTPQRVSEPLPYETRALANPVHQFLPGFALQVRGFALSPTVDSKAPQQTNWYDNLGLAVMYQINANHSAGIDLGSESFPMVFEGDRNGQVIRYDQYPSSIWAGATYRVTGNTFGSSPVSPFGQVTIGGSKFGPIGRVASGIQYSPSGPVSLMLGVEAASLAYTFQNQWYLSPKFGLTYGMAVRF
jgi:hypothetical protein